MHGMKGSKDKSIPSVVSVELEELLRAGGATVSSCIYQDMSHTDPILENVLEGNTELVVDMINAIESTIHHNTPSTIIIDNCDHIDKAGAAENQNHTTYNSIRQEETAVVNCDRCEQYLQHSEAASWPISKGMMRFARMMNPF